MSRAVRFVIRLIASGIILFGGLEFGLEYLRHRMRKVEMSVRHCVTGGILIVFGIILFWASAWLAEQLTDDSEE